MASENGEISAPSMPLAYRLLERALCSGPQMERFSPEWMSEDFALLPSGSARLAVLQSMAVAAMAIHRVADAEGRTVEAVLAELWPPKAALT